MACCSTRERINLKRWRVKKEPKKPPVLKAWPEDLYVYTPSAHTHRLEAGDEYFNPLEAEWLHEKMLEFQSLRDIAIKNGMSLSSTAEINEEVANLRVDRAPEP